MSLDDNGKPFQHHIALASITGKVSNRINPDEVVFKEQIGEGSFGIVSKGEWRGYSVAIKTVNKNIIFIEYFNIITPFLEFNFDIHDNLHILEKNEQKLTQNTQNIPFKSA